MLIRRFLLFVATIWLASCASELHRHGDLVDGPPKEMLLAEDILDAVPRPDPILKQGNLSPYEQYGVLYEILDKYEDYSEEGLASWYGMKFHGKPTSNGEIFDINLPTAAHRSLPIPCYVRVTNLDNGRSMIVRVNDRGPFHPGRIIDLSFAAATKLDFVDKGVARVRVSFIKVLGVDDRRPKKIGEYRYIQLGAFKSKTAADLLKSKIGMISDSPVFISPVQLAKSILYRVRVGPLQGTSAVLAEIKLLELKGFGAGLAIP